MVKNIGHKPYWAQEKDYIVIKGKTHFETEITCVFHLMLGCNTFSHLFLERNEHNKHLREEMIYPYLNVLLSYVHTFLSIENICPQLCM